MKKILLILIAFAPIFAMAQFEAGEYVNSDTLKNKGVNVYVDHLKNFVESDSGKILMHRNETATWENLNTMNIVTGSGTYKYIPCFASSSTLMSSGLYWSGSSLRVSNAGESSISPNRLLHLQMLGQPTFAFSDLRGATGNKEMGFLYDAGISLTHPGLVWQRYTDAGGFVKNLNTFWQDGSISFGSITHPGTAGQVIFGGGNVGIATSSPQQKLHVSGNILADTCFTTKNSSLMNASNYYVRGDSTKAYIDRKVVGGSGMTWPSTAGIANYAGSSAWGTSITTSAGLSGVLTDETGSGSAVFSTSPTLTTPTVATSFTGSYLTASTLLSANASKQIVSLSTTNYPNLGEISYVKGVTSSIQTQLDSKGTVKGSGDTNNQLAYWTNATTLGFLPLTIYPTLAELSYVKGVTSSIQSQINAISNPWTNDTYGMHYSNNIGIGASSISNNKLYLYQSGYTTLYSVNTTGVAVSAESSSGPAIYGASTSDIGVHGYGYVGVRGDGTSSGSYGVSGYNSANGIGVYGYSNSSFGGLFEGLGCKATKFYVSALNTAPASASSTGTTGEIRFCDSYIYVCTATNTWKRVALSTW